MLPCIGIQAQRCISSCIPTHFVLVGNAFLVQLFSIVVCRQPFSFQVLGFSRKGA